MRQLATCFAVLVLCLSGGTSAIAQSTNGPAKVTPGGPAQKSGTAPVVTQTGGDEVFEEIVLVPGTNEFVCHEGIPLFVEVFGNGSAATISYDSGNPIGVGLLTDLDGVKYSNGSQSVQVNPDSILYEDGSFLDTCFVPGSPGAASTEERFPEEEPEADFGEGQNFMTLPMEAKSGGGIVRAGPGMDFGKVTSLAPMQPLTIVEDTGVMMNGYPWYRVVYRGGEGYQWGGIICSIGTLYVGTYGLCD